MLKNLSLTAKLSLVPAVALVGLVLYVVYTSLQLSATDSRLVLLETRSYPTLEKADAVIFQFSRVPALLNNAVAAGEPGILDEAREVLQQIDSQQQALASLLSEQRQQHQALSDWRKAVRDYADNALAASTKLIDGSASFDDLRPSLDRMASDLAQAQKLGSDFRAQAYDDFQQTLVQTREANAATTRLGIILSLVLVVLVSLGAWLVIRSVMVNIRGVITSLQSIARGDGDLTQRVNVESNDEIGAMIELFNSFLDKLQRTIRQIIEAANPLGQVSKELYKLTQGSEENAKSQQHHTDSITRDILTMTGSIQEVAQRSQQASDEANSAARQAATAREHVGSLSTGISDLGDSVMGAVKAMEQLEEETQEVGSVLTVIRSIAEQTNLLALNAAIEAARAGEQGRGFAVVADEVRNLAQKTAASTAEIQQIIQRLQNSANTVLNVMTSNGEKSRASIERSIEATQLLEAIAGTVNQIDELNAGIAQFTQEQIGLSSSIRQETQVLQQDAQATANGAEATARLGEQLVSTGDHLRAATGQFRV
ncbi:methyl-accepting chemotaxis protein [Stutzerimonas kunmingensis]|jgi:methyl-accepting chemotaxis protein|uniref:methyl-accepting chemotaxis protein n=1 Tax=Stutzerimonas kunmingensis TaxID=1211807 RepID=UPI000C6578E0|nr:methyl-accepting chemotaxis protein [Stutzerimonas kunmingensis]MAK86666.1 chemotaxis protein [Pseudomonas sp.]MBD3874563.1 methyl-accepting chemotaxis protein [Stutzerimonas kunmingensis]MBU2011405.1 methyl-accepting chemotaxis protein [Gammaproteobacteria bacterium]MBU2333400.1 methyl-accepting chemotaxis protein [Gammaproteobacteria bacterium]